MHVSKNMKTIKVVNEMHDNKIKWLDLSSVCHCPCQANSSRFQTPLRTNQVQEPITK